MNSFPFSAKRRAANRRAPFFRRVVLPPLCATVALALCVGCGTTKFSDTGRTATEQLLISSAMEDVVDEYDYSRLAGLKVFLKVANSTTDADYLKSILRQQLAANGVFIKDVEADADYILEVAPGTVGTNRYELMYGIPETSIPAIGALTSATSIPEFALVKRTDQKAQVKIVMWAYNRTTGAIVWQSGVKTKSSKIRDRWIFGAGPFTEASYDDARVRLGADALPSTLGEKISNAEKPSVRSEAVYQELDAEAIERLEKIRKEGLAEALGETAAEAEAAAKAEGLEVDDGKDDAPNAKKDGAQDGSDEKSATSSAPSPAVKPTATPANRTPETVAPSPSPSPSPVSNPGAEPTSTPQLVFGDEAVLNLRSVYVPDGRKRL